MHRRRPLHRPDVLRRQCERPVGRYCGRSYGGRNRQRLVEPRPRLHSADGGGRLGSALVHHDPREFSGRAESVYGPGFHWQRGPVRTVRPNRRSNMRLRVSRARDARPVRRQIEGRWFGVRLCDGPRPIVRCPGHRHRTGRLRQSVPCRHQFVRAVPHAPRRCEFGTGFHLRAGRLHWQPTNALPISVRRGHGPAGLRPQWPPAAHRSAKCPADLRAFLRHTVHRGLRQLGLQRAEHRHLSRRASHVLWVLAAIFYAGCAGLHR